MFKNKGQGALEYLLLIGGGVVVAAIVVVLVLGFGGAGTESAKSSFDIYQEGLGARVTAGGGTVEGAEGSDVVGPGDSVTFTANPTGGTGPYTCDWTVTLEGTTVDSFSECASISRTYSDIGTYTATLVVTDTGTDPEAVSSPKNYSFEVAEAFAEFALFSDGTELPIGPNGVPEVNLAKVSEITLSCEGSFVPGGSDPICDWTGPNGFSANGTEVTMPLPANTVDFYSINLTLQSGAANASQEFEVYFLEDFSDPTSFDWVDNIVNGTWSWVETDGFRTGGLLKGDGTVWSRVALNISATDSYSLKSDVRLAQGQYGILMSSYFDGSNNYALWSNHESTNRAFLRRNDGTLNNVISDIQFTQTNSHTVWYGYELKKLNSVLSGTVDGVPVCDTQLGGDGACERTVDDLTGKKIALAGYKAASPVEVYFDNIELRPLK